MVVVTLQIQPLTYPGLHPRIGKPTFAQWNTHSTSRRASQFCSSLRDGSGGWEMGWVMVGLVGYYTPTYILSTHCFYCC